MENVELNEMRKHMQTKIKLTWTWAAAISAVSGIFFQVSIGCFCLFSTHTGSAIVDVNWQLKWLHPRMTLQKYCIRLTKLCLSAYYSIENSISKFLLHFFPCFSPIFVCFKIKWFSWFQPVFSYSFDDIYRVEWYFHRPLYVALMKNVNELASVHHYGLFQSCFSDRIGEHFGYSRINKSILLQKCSEKSTKILKNHKKSLNKWLRHKFSLSFCEFTRNLLNRFCISSLVIEPHGVSLDCDLYKGEFSSRKRNTLLNKLFCN